MDRRQLLKRAVGGVVGLAGMSVPAVAGLSRATGRRQAGAARLRDGLSLVDAGTNVIVLATDSGAVLVDTGAPDRSDQLTRSLDGLGVSDRVRSVINTHWHLENTGSNERFGNSGAQIIAHENTRLWMSTPYWIPGELRYAAARPEPARPTQTFYTDGEMVAGGERIEYGYLIEAHTNADIYVFFRNANVLAVGDVASPVLDPALDFFTGAWLGGRIDAMDRLLEISDEETIIVPGFGPVMNRIQLEVERDTMATIYERTVDLAREGASAANMLEAGVMEGLARTWDDPGRFLDDVYRGLWAHHNKLAPNVV